jgi:hypothetical protein
MNIFRTVAALILSLALGSAAEAAAVTWQGQPVPITATGTITWNFPYQQPPATMSVAATGAASLTWGLQCLDQNNVWQTVAMSSPAAPASTPVTSATGDGFYAANVGNFISCRVNISAYSSGTETFALGTSQQVLVPILAIPGGGSAVTSVVAGNGLTGGGSGPGVVTLALASPVSVANGGTGATAAGATAANNIGALAQSNNLSDLASASTARTNLGLGTAATQNTGTSGATIPLLNAANTWSGVQTHNSGDLALAGSTSGSTTLNAAATASGTLTLPAATDTLVGRATTDTLTNKTLTTPTINGAALSGTLSGSPTASGTWTYSTLPTFPSIASGSLLGNSTGSSAAPAATTLTSLLDTIGLAQGDILYRGASNWAVLVPSTSGNCLQTGGTGANPSWGACGGGTIPSGTAGQIPMYASSGSTVTATTFTGDVTNNASGVTTVNSYGGGTLFGTMAGQAASAYCALIGGSNCTLTGQLVNEAGACPGPALTFGDSATGLYKLATNSIGYCANGTAAWSTAASGLTSFGAGLQVTSGNTNDNLDQFLINGTNAATASSGASRSLAITAIQAPTVVTSSYAVLLSPHLGNATNAQVNFEGTLTQLNIDSTYTGTHPALTYYEAQNLTDSGSAAQSGNLIGFLSDARSWGNTITTGQANAYAFRDAGATGAAGTGGIVHNYGAYLTLGTGNSATTVDAGLVIDGNGGASSTNYGYWETSTAQNVLTGSLAANGGFTASGANVNDVLSPTGTGIVTINPATAGSMNNVTIGNVTPLVITGTYVSANIVFQTKGTGYGTQSAGLMSVTGIAGAPTLVSGGNGALYLSATLGSILQGYASTADVTLENHSGAAALEVLSGTTNVQIPGQLFVTNLLESSTQPSIASAGCGGSGAAMNSNNGTAAFRINVGTSPGSACTITMPAASNGWNCMANDLTTQSTSIAVQRQAPSGSQTTTSVVITNYSDISVATAFTASDLVAVNCMAL